MQVAIIGRSEIMYDTALLLQDQGHEIALIVTSKEAPDYARTADDFRHLADSLGCPFIRTTRITGQIEVIRALPKIDIAASVNYAGVIPQDVVDCFELGILNAHGGDLPRYRGNACQAWAILNGEDKIGLCIHRMVGGELDSGDIVAREYHSVSIDTKVTEIWHWMQQRTPHLIGQAMSRLAENPAFALEQQSLDPAQTLRCYPRRPEDGRLDWRRDAVDMLRLINASNKPYTGAFCELEGKRLIIWDAELVGDGEIYLAVPGQITEIGSGWVRVATGSGKLQINRVEVDGAVTSPDRLVTSLRTRLS
jgi:UDP-4-amino-4-deoxy-L-arabinose formyltransferase/UDP-glucuronic acid dehydrogenase (UDP-4-keto-hexauronic acid decarboxylating)